MQPQPQPIEPPSFPRIPLGKLWTSLVVPPLLAAIAGTVAGGKLRSEPDLVQLVFMIVTIGFTLMLFMFESAAGSRYRGSSLTFLTLAWLLGQIIVCLAICLGCGLLVFSQSAV